MHDLSKERQVMKSVEDHFRSIGGEYWPCVDGVDKRPVHSFYLSLDPDVRIADVVPDSPFLFGLGPFHPPVGDHQLAGISRHTNLCHLNLTETHVTNEGLSHLVGLKNLEWLFLGWTSVSSIGLRTLGQIESLSSLFLDRTHRIDPEGIEQLARCQQLSELDISFHPVPVEMVHALSQLRSLKRLFVTMHDLTDAAVATLFELKTLRDLRLRGDAVSELQIDHLNRLENVEIHFEACGIKDSELEPLARLVNLRSASGNLSDISDEGLRLLCQAKALEKLVLRGAIISNIGLQELIHLPHLSSLDLLSSSVTDSGLEHISKLRRLSSLSLVGTAITDVGIRRLAGLRALSWLNLEHTEVTAQAVRELQTALPNCVIKWSGQELQ